MKTPKNRIIDQIQIRAGDIVPHELNPRTHTDAQRKALAGLLDEIGFARSLLAYRLPDGRLKLIDGRLRQLDKAAKAGKEPLPDQFLVLITCQNEQEQVSLLRRFKKEGLQCTAKIA